MIYTQTNTVRDPNTLKSGYRNSLYDESIEKNSLTSRKDKVKEHFSNKTEYWDSLYDETNGKQSFTKFELKKRKEIVFDFISRLSFKPNQTALDIGCGAGHYLVNLSNIGYSTVGADNSEEMLLTSKNNLAKASFQETKLINADCYNIPFPSDHFNLIISIGVLEYLSKETKALGEMHRLIKPDGNIMVTFPNVYKLRNLINPYYYLIRVWSYLFGKKGAQYRSDIAADKQAKIDFGKSTVTRYSFKKVRKLIESSGYRINEYRGYCFGPFALWQKSFFSLERSINISEFIEGLQRFRIFGFLSFFANRWVLWIQPINSPGLNHSINKQVIDNETKQQ